MPWQVRHSKVRSSKPRSPGEIRTNPILCLQVRQVGRSTMDDIRTAQPPLKPMCFSRCWSARFPTFYQNLPQANKRQSRDRRFALGYRPWEGPGLLCLGL
jgi:hypothetical protein